MKIEIDDKTFALVVKRAALNEKLINDTDRDLHHDICEELCVIENTLSEYLHNACGITDRHIAEHWRLERDDAA